MTSVQLNTYAARINQSYHTDDDRFITVPERLNEMFQKDPELEVILKSLAQGMVAAMGYSSYTEMLSYMVGMGVKEYYPASIVDINDTMQRWPDRENLLNIVGGFDASYVNRIRTYLDSHRSDIESLVTTTPKAAELDSADQLAMLRNRHVAWDGQHTVLALYVIGHYGFGLEIDQILVPVDEYPGDDRSAIRRRFVEFNSGKTSKKLDNIDLYKQYVAGMRHDKVQEFWNLRCYTMQTYFEKYGYFATDEKFGDEKRAGAWSRMTEVFNRNFPVEVFERVMYYHSISNNNQPFAPLEIDNLSVFFRQCLNDGIKLTNEYLDEINRIMTRVTQNTWAVGSVKHRKVQDAYQSHVDKEKAAGRLIDGQTYRCNQTKVAPDWIKQVLAKHGFKYQLPAFAEHYDFDQETLK